MQSSSAIGNSGLSASSWGSDHIPRGDHVVVHLLQLLLGGLEFV